MANKIVNTVLNINKANMTIVATGLVMVGDWIFGLDLPKDVATAAVGLLAFCLVWRVPQLGK